MLRAIIARILAVCIVIVGLVILWSTPRAEPMRGHPIGKECDEP